MADHDHDDRSGPGDEGFLESTLRDATITGTDDDPPPPPEEPQGVNPGTTSQSEGADRT